MRDLGREVEHQPRSHEWPDAALLVEGEVIGVEAVEVVEEEHRRHVPSQGWYVDGLRSAFDAAGISPALLGMALELSDGYCGLPRAPSRAARNLVAVIAEQMGEHRGRLAGTEVNVVRIVNFDAEPWKVSLFRARVVENADGYVLRRNGAYMAAASRARTQGASRTTRTAALELLGRKQDCRIRVGPPGPKERYHAGLPDIVSASVL